MKEKVIIARCRDYEVDRIAKIIAAGMDELKVVPSGKVLVKPNVVIAHKILFPHAFVRSEFIDGLLQAIKSKGNNISELAVGERCGITIPTRFAFSQAGYNKVIRKHKVKKYCFEECFQVERKLQHPDRLRDYIYIPQPIDECEFLVNVPKLKSHPWTKITAALKNFIGLQDDKHRLIDHDYLLETKIADLQEVIQPKFIAMDTIVAGEMKMLTPKPYPLGAIIMGTNQVAIDTVACNIIGFDPHKVTHIVSCHKRGYGPIDINEIDIVGDFPLKEIQKVAHKFRVPEEKVDEVFNNKSRITTYVGSPPDPQKMDYCWGGCPGALIEAMEIAKTIQPNVHNEVKPLHIVYGKYEGEIKAKPDERIIFCGDCAKYSGTINDKQVEIPFLYISRDKKDPHKATAKGLILRMILFLWNIFKNRKSQVLRAKGCPVSVAENILYLWKPGGAKNPYLDMRIIFPFLWAYITSKLVKIYRALFWRRPKAKS